MEKFIKSCASRKSVHGTYNYSLMFGKFSLISPKDDQAWLFNIVKLVDKSDYFLENVTKTLFKIIY